jgi:molecular chaperone GrpE
MSDEQEEQPEKNDKKLGALVQALETERKRSEDYLTRLKYMQADFENWKKRLDRQMEEARKFSNEHLILELLTVIDELEAAVDSGSSSNCVDTLIQGIEMTLKKLRKLLENEEVFQIVCDGKTFNPSHHDVIAKIERNDIEEGKIVKEVRKGYIMRGKVIRPSIVKIAVNPASKSHQEEKASEQ